MSKKLFYDSTDADTLAASDFVGSHLYAGDEKLTQTTTAGKVGLDVYITNPLTVNLDGVYDGTDNLNPDNAGLIAHARGATPGAADQNMRTTAGTADSDNLVPANIHALDVNAFGMVYDGANWDRLTGTNGALNIADGGNSITTDTTSDPALANAGIDNAAIAISDVATKVVATDLANRKYLFLYNKGTTEVFIGKQASLAAANGFPVYPGIYMEMRIGAAVALYGISPTGKTNDIRHLQVA